MTVEVASTGMSVSRIPTLVEVTSINQGQTQQNGGNMGSGADNMDKMETWQAIQEMAEDFATADHEIVFVQDEEKFTGHEHTDSVNTVREDILDTAKQYVTQDRNNTHGEPEDSFSLIAQYWTVYLNRVTDDGASVLNLQSHDVSAMMALMKIARLTDNPFNADNWIDLAGYAACGAECAGAE